LRLREIKGREGRKKGDQGGKKGKEGGCLGFRCTHNIKKEKKKRGKNSIRKERGGGLSEKGEKKGGGDLQIYDVEEREER